MGHANGSEVFAQFDVDNDGMISRAELVEGFSKLGEALSETDVDRFMQLADANGDGEFREARDAQDGLEAHGAA